MSVRFGDSSAVPSPSPSTARLVALKQQIKARNPGLLSSSRSLRRRRSLLLLHQQQMELMTPESFDPFTETAAEETAAAAAPHAKHSHRRDRSDRGEELAGRAGGGLARAHSHSRSASIAAKPVSLSGGRSARAGAEARLQLVGRRATAAKAEAEAAMPLKLNRAEMRQLLSQLHTQHPALLPSAEEEEKEQERPAARSGEMTAAAGWASWSTSVPSSAAVGSVAARPASPSTPRLSFSQKRVDKFDESVKVMMSFSHADMELIRTSILQRGGGVTRQQFLAITVKKAAGDDGYEREVEALAEMFEEIDVNGDGQLQYGEFTSYLVELANGRYDHHHIDQLLHTDYRGLEPVSNDDRIDVLSIAWYAGLGLFVMLEKGQSRFKLLDGIKKTVRVVRGHAGEILCCEWLPLHGLLVTAARDRTLRFWAHEDGESGTEARGSSGSAVPQTAGKAAPAAGVRRKSSHGSSSSSAFPGFQCLSVWPLPSPQVCLCWSKQRLYSADILGRLLVWNIDVGEIKNSLQAHDGRVTALVAMQEENCIASAGMDSTVRVWDCSDLRCAASWKHEGAVRCLCWDAERRLLLSGGDDESLRVWSVEKKQQLRLLNFREEDEKEARRRDGAPRVDGKGEGAAASAGKRKDAEAAAGTAADGGLSGDSLVGMVVTGCEALVISQCGLIRVLDLRKWTVEQTLALPRVWDDRSRDDEEDEDNDDDQQEEAKETAALRSRQLVTSHTVYSPRSCSSLLSSSCSPSSEQHELVISAGSCLYSFTRNSAVNHGIADSHPILSALYLSGPFTIMTASHRSLKVWDCITGRLLKEFHDIVPRGVVVSSVCVDGRGRKVIVGGSDGRVVVFNCNTGAQMQQLTPHHDADVLCLSYVEEVQAAGRDEEGEAEAGPAVPAASSGGGQGVSKVLCSARHGVFIHHDDHEAALANSAYISLYHSCFHHRADITALIASQRFGVIASASADESIILYPANLDGTPLQRIHLGSRVEALLFLHPFRLLLAASGGSRLTVHCFSNEQHELIGHWRSGEGEAGGEAGEGEDGEGGSEGGVVQHLVMDAATETLYTGDDAGCITAWPLSDALFSPFRALLAEQQLSLSSHQLPDPQALLRFFPRGLQAVKRSLVVRAHTEAVTGVSVIPGRDKAWSAEAMAAAEARERDVLREEEEWKEQMKEAYENAAYRTAQLLYEGGTTAAAFASAASAQSLSVAPSSLSGSSLSISELLSLLSAEQLQQLDKEKRRIARQLQQELSQHFTQRRAQNAALLSSHLRSLDLQHGSATAILSSGADGCVHLHSVEDGSCLGSLHQGEVATLGLGTPAQWKYHVNMEERKRTDRQRLSQCVQEMEHERALLQRDEEQRKEEAALAARLREDERTAAREEEDDPNDPLPFERAATTEQKKLMDRVEESITQTINSPAFQAKVRPEQHRDRREEARGANTLPPALPAAAAGAGRLLPVHVSAASGLPGLTRLSAVSSSALLPLASPSGQQHRSLASQQLDVDYSRELRPQRRSRDRAQAPPLQLSQAQQMKAAIAKAVPLRKKQQQPEEEEESKEAAAAVTAADRRKARTAGVSAAAQGENEEMRVAMRAAMDAVSDRRLLLKAIAKAVRQPAGQSSTKAVKAPTDDS